MMHIRLGANLFWLGLLFLLGWHVSDFIEYAAIVVCGLGGHVLTCELFELLEDIRDKKVKE